MDWKLFFRILLTSKEIFFSFYELVDIKMFKDAVKANLMTLVKGFAAKHHRAPDFDTLLLLLEKLPKDEKQNRDKYIDFITEVGEMEFEVDVDEAYEIISKVLQDWELEQFVLKTANSVGTVSVPEVIGNLRDIERKFVARSSGMDVTDVARVIQTIKQRRGETISTGLSDLDNSMLGGYSKDEITIMGAPPGRGKSFFLMNAMYYAMLAGHHPLYVTLELSERAVLRRLYGRVAVATRREMVDEEEIQRTDGKFFTLSKAQGKIVYYPGRTLTVAALEGLMESQDASFGFRPNILIVDYLDRLAPSKGDARQETRHQLRNITDDLRSIALRHNVPVVTATQATRASLTKKNPTEKDVSESFGKVEVADVIMALAQSDEEKMNNKARLIMLKNREHVSGNTIEVFTDFERMFLADLEMAQKLGYLFQDYVE